MAMTTKFIENKLCKTCEKNFILKIFEKLSTIKLIQTRENSKDGLIAKNV